MEMRWGRLPPCFALLEDLNKHQTSVLEEVLLQESRSVSLVLIVHGGRGGRQA